MKKDLIKDFKELTGCKLSDVAEKFGVSRQRISASLKNHSLTYKASSAYFLNKIIDEKLAECRHKIWQLNQLKGAIEDSVTNDE